MKPHNHSNPSGICHDIAHLRALRFIKQNEGQHLSRDRALLIDRAIHHVMLDTDCSTMTAERVVVRALAEHESRDQRAYIDVDETTAHAVFVKDPLTKCTRVFTVADLMRLVRTPELAAMPTPSKRAACSGQYL